MSRRFNDSLQLVMTSLNSNPFMNPRFTCVRWCVLANRENMRVCCQLYSWIPRSGFRLPATANFWLWFHLFFLAEGESTEFSSSYLSPFPLVIVLWLVKYLRNIGIESVELEKYIMDAIKKGIGKVFGIRKSNEGTSEIGQIGHPTNVVHGTHVTVDKVTGQLHGLPPQWDRLLRKELGYVKWACTNHGLFPRLIHVLKN